MSSCVSVNPILPPLFGLSGSGGDMIVSFYPPDDDSEQNDLLLNVRLLLRPTIPHPDLTNILDAEGSHLGAAIRLGLDRDMGKPVDVLEIDGHANEQQVMELEHVLCNEVPHLGQFCSLQGNEDIGKVVGTTGEILQSYPLALTQLLNYLPYAEGCRSRRHKGAIRTELSYSTEQVSLGQMDYAPT